MKRHARQVVDEWLVLKAQAGSRAAAEELLRRCQGPLLRHAARLTGDAEAARDIWQESALAIAQGLTGLRDPAMFHAWSYRVATHKSRDWQRRRYRDAGQALDGSETAPARGPATDAGVTGDAVRHVLGGLSRDDRAVLSLFYLDGFGTRDIARILDLEINAVKTRLCRARKRFRTAWDTADGE